MKPPEEISLHTEPPRSLTFYEVLRDIGKRTDAECEFAWSVFDDMMPGDFMDCLNRFAAHGLSTEEIWQCTFVSGGRFEQVKDWKPRMHELVCLAVERAVRKAK